MDNKVLVKLFVPEIDSTFDVFIPVNEVVWKIKKMLVKAINDVVNVDFDMTKNYILINSDNSRVYKNNEIAIDTDIRNASELILFSKYE